MLFLWVWCCSSVVMVVVRRYLVLWFRVWVGRMLGVCLLGDLMRVMFDFVWMRLLNLVCLG